MCRTFQLSSEWNTLDARPERILAYEQRIRHSLESKLRYTDDDDNRHYMAVLDYERRSKFMERWIHSSIEMSFDINRNRRHAFQILNDDRISVIER